MKGPFVILFACLLGGCHGDQALVDYMASNLILEYELVDNWDSVPSWLCHVRLTITNSGHRDIEATDQAWSIYFDHFRLLNGTRHNPDGVPIGISGLRGYHINGAFHRMSPSESFPGWAAGHTEVLDIYAESHEIAKTDVFPNWYVAEDDTLPRTIQSVADESLSFVGDFTEAKQYKRSASELNEPYSPEGRFGINSAEDLGGPGKRIMPSPVSESWDEEGPTIDITTGDWVIVLHTEELRTEAEFLSDKLNGAIIVDQQPPSYFIGLQLGQVGDDDGDIDDSEAYNIVVAEFPDHVDITGNARAGVLWGIQSLLALSEDDNGIPTGSVVDYPRFPYRGVHLDVSRNFQTKEDVIRLMAAMSMYKLNKLHLHLTDDEGWRLEIPGMEELAEVGGRRCHDLEETICIVPNLGSGPGVSTSGTGFYTVSDYREILQYATDNHIQVIPEFDVPGHAHAAIKAMEARYHNYVDEDPEKAEEFLLSEFDDQSVYMSVQNWYDGATNPCIDSTYNFIRHLIKEVKAMHEDIQPLTLFNFGGDEVPSGAWAGSPSCQDLIDSDPELGSVADLQHYFVKRVGEIVEEEELNLAGWEDGLMHNYHEVYDREDFDSEDVLAYAWNNVWESGSGHKAYLLANNSYRVVLSHATHFYFDHPYEPDPDDRGLYWATRFIPTKRSFAYMPDDVYANIDFSGMGHELDRDEICATHNCGPLDPSKVDYVIGMQGQVWSETVRSSANMEYMFFPRLLALAERAWHRADWELEEDEDDQETARDEDWTLFANSLGHRELGRLGKLGIQYEIPPPGARLTEDLELEANVAYPGLPLRYSLDVGDSWLDYTTGVVIDPETPLLVVATSADGSRFGRQVALP